MITRKDEYNFIIYHIISVFDPEEEGRSQGLNERFQEMRAIIETNTIQKFCKLLSIIREDPPVPIERLDRISAYWNCF
jgi:hypothetical protein